MRAPRADSPRIEDAGNAPREMKYGKWNPGRRPIDPVGLIGSPVTAPKKKLKDQGGKALNSKQVTEQPSAQGSGVENEGKESSNQAAPTPSEVPISEVNMEGADGQTEEGKTLNAITKVTPWQENNAFNTANDRKDKKDGDDDESVNLEDFEEFTEKLEAGKNGTQEAKENLNTQPELLSSGDGAGGLNYNTEPTMAEFLEAAEKDELSETEEIKNAVARQKREKERQEEANSLRNHELIIESKRREAPGIYGAPKEKTVIDANRQHRALGVGHTVATMHQMSILITTCALLLSDLAVCQ